MVISRLRSIIMKPRIEIKPKLKRPELVVGWTSPLSNLKTLLCRLRLFQNSDGPTGSQANELVSVSQTRGL